MKCGKYENRFWKRHECIRFTMFECLQAISLFKYVYEENADGNEKFGNI